MLPLTSNSYGTSSAWQEENAKLQKEIWKIEEQLNFYDIHHPQINTPLQKREAELYQEKWTNLINLVKRLEKLVEVFFIDSFSCEEQRDFILTRKESIIQLQLKASNHLQNYTNQGIKVSIQLLTHEVNRDLSKFLATSLTMK